MKDPNEVDVQELLRRVLTSNVRDAKEAIAIAERLDDDELRELATADLKKWEERLAKLRAVE